VLLAVPFALSGGVYLLWLTGYHFSVAVWVGFIALFGTAVQTAVVMVIYLEDAVARRRVSAGAGFGRADLRAAIIEGALLRLRPKVMTVSTVVAGLLPIMWSSRAGAEIMKPLATPVLGGMVSSLVHVLVVTPVIFFWLRARELPAETEVPRPAAAPGMRGGVLLWGAVVVLMLALMLAAGVSEWRLTRGSGNDSVGVPVQSVSSGAIRVTILSESGVLRLGRNRFWLEFRDVGGRLVDAGEVHLAAAMTMPGMTMSGGIEVVATRVPGRYQATGEFGMAGVWQMTMQWNGPDGRGSVAFQGSIQ
jgi:Cu(I)/Ag(I) efflux system membrane protein CusA/SilA